MPRGHRGLVDSFAGGGGSALAEQIDRDKANLYALTGMDREHSIILGDTDVLADYSSKGGLLPHENTTEVDSYAWVVDVSDSMTRGATNATVPRAVILDQNRPWGYSQRFRIAATTGNGFYLAGMLDPTSVASAPGVSVGCDLGTNPIFFAFFKKINNVPTFDEQPSTIPVDMAWHRGTVFAPGDGFYYGRIDNETPVQLTNAHTYPAPGILAAPGFMMNVGGGLVVHARPPIFLLPMEF